MKMTNTVAAHLVALGWSNPVALARGARVVGGPKGGPTLVIEPRRRADGPAIDLRAALPAGARIEIPGEGVGAVEYSTRSHYVRLSAEQDHEDPCAVLAGLLDADASISF